MSAGPTCGPGECRFGVTIKFPQQIPWQAWVGVRRDHFQGLHLTAQAWPGQDSDSRLRYGGPGPACRGHSLEMAQGSWCPSSESHPHGWDRTPGHRGWLGPRSPLLGPADNHFFFFLGDAASCGMWDLSSPTRDQTHTPCIGSTES